MRGFGTLYNSLMRIKAMLQGSPTTRVPSHFCSELGPAEERVSCARDTLSHSTSYSAFTPSLDEFMKHTCVPTGVQREVPHRARQRAVALDLCALEIALPPRPPASFSLAIRVYRVTCVYTTLLLCHRSSRRASLRCHAVVAAPQKSAPRSWCLLALSRCFCRAI